MRKMYSPAVLQSDENQEFLAGFDETIAKANISQSPGFYTFAGATT